MMNLWLNIWIRPRETIREIIETDTSLHVIPLAMIAGVLGMLENFTSRSVADDIGLTAVLVTAAVVGPLSGLFGVYFGGWLLRWSGSLLGGKATSDEVRTALAWSSFVQSVSNGFFLVLMIAFVGREAFFSQTPILDAKMESNELFALFGVLYFSIFTVLAIIFGIWYVIVYLKCLGEAHQFSAWKALFATIIPALIIMVPILIVVLLLL